jgi:hypothetical protein
MMTIMIVFSPVPVFTMFPMVYTHCSFPPFPIPPNTFFLSKM